MNKILLVVDISSNVLLMAQKVKWSGGISILCTKLRYDVKPVMNHIVKLQDVGSACRYKQTVVFQGSLDSIPSSTP